MTTDADILAIRRRRHREGRCIACGAAVARGPGCPRLLCPAHAERHSCCPCCLDIRPRVPSLAPGRTSDRCPACHQALRKGRQARTPRAVLIQHRADARARLLRQIIARYRRGESYAEIAAALKLRRDQLLGRIRNARRSGEWPRGLTSQTSPPGLLSTAEAAARLGTTQRVIQHRITRGTLDAVRRGRFWFVRGL